VSPETGKACPAAKTWNCCLRTPRTSPDDGLEISWFGPRATLGECPRWDEQAQRLSWVDIGAGVLHVASLDTSDPAVIQHPIRAPLAGAVLTDGTDEVWLVALGTSLAMWAADTGQATTERIENDSAPSPLRLNEVTDPVGRLWLGSMTYDWTVGAGSYFRVDLDGTVRRVLTGITVANGVGWSPDGSRMYTTDTGAGHILTWDYDLDTGQPANCAVQI